MTQRRNRKKSPLVNIYDYLVVESTSYRGPCGFCECNPPDNWARIRIAGINYCVKHAAETVLEWMKAA